VEAAGTMAGAISTGTPASAAEATRTRADATLMMLNIFKSPSARSEGGRSAPGKMKYAAGRPEEKTSIYQMVIGLRRSSGDQRCPKADKR
jgi:hypothetical protein